MPSPSAQLVTGQTAAGIFATAWAGICACSCSRKAIAPGCVIAAPLGTANPGAGDIPSPTTMAAANLLLCIPIKRRKTAIRVPTTKLR
jgi:hypothetical protein